MNFKKEQLICSIGALIGGIAFYGLLCAFGLC